MCLREKITEKNCCKICVLNELNCVLKNEQKSERNISGILQFTISLELSFIFPFEERIFRFANPIYGECVLVQNGNLMRILH